MADDDALIDAIASCELDAVAMLEEIDDYCFENGAGCTPAAAAVRNDNLDALRVIPSSRDALEYFPALDADLRRRASMSAGMLGSEDVEKAEQYVANILQGTDNYERTPLLEACRHANRDAIRLLVQAGAKLTAKDALKYNASELCLHHGEDLLEFLLDCCIEAGKKLPVDDYLLSRMCREPSLYEKAKEHGRLSKKARDFRFLLACALLDVADVRRQIDDGYTIGPARAFEYDPVIEAVSSNLLWGLEHPRRFELSKAVLRALDKNTGGGAPTDVDPVLETEQTIETRLHLMDVLIEGGMDASAGNPRDPLDLLGNLVYTNEPRLLEKSLAAGILFRPADIVEDNPVQTAIQYLCFRMVAPLVDMGAPIPAVEAHWKRAWKRYLAWCGETGVEPVAASTNRRADESVVQIPVDFVPGFKAIWNSPYVWQTAGESLLQAALIESGAKTVVRLSYSNIYGPVDNVVLQVRAGDGHWIDPDLVEEIVDVDGDTRLRAEGETFDDETPWSATWEAELQPDVGEHRMEISLTSPIEGINDAMLFDDWTISLPG